MKQMMARNLTKSIDTHSDGKVTAMMMTQTKTMAMSQAMLMEPQIQCVAAQSQVSLDRYVSRIQWADEEYEIPSHVVNNPVYLNQVFASKIPKQYRNNEPMKKKEKSKNFTFQGTGSLFDPFILKKSSKMVIDDHLKKQKNNISIIVKQFGKVKKKNDKINVKNLHQIDKKNFGAIEEKNKENYFTLPLFSTMSNKLKNKLNQFERKCIILNETNCNLDEICYWDMR